MLTKEAYDLVMSGKKPVVKFNQLIEEYDESFDQIMKARIVDVHLDNGCAAFHCDMNEFLEYNKTYESPTFYDSKGNPTLKWHETRYFPKNGIETVYVALDVEAPFEIEEENKLYMEYLRDNVKLSYTEWMETHLLQLRETKQIKEVMNTLKNIVKESLPDSEFNIDITYKSDTNQDEDYWMISGRIDTKNDWNDFLSTHTDFEAAVEQAKEGITILIQELQAGVA